jgi:transposase
MTDGAPQHDENSGARIAALEAELSALRQERDQAEHEREQYRKLYMLVLYELERLKRQLFGKKAETVDPTQVQLVFGPVFDALARAEQGDQDAQDDVRAGA